MSVLDSSIAQILALDGDQRRRKLIDYISEQPEPVRAALLIPNDPGTGQPDKTKQDTLLGLSKGFPDSGYQIDPEIMLRGTNPLVAMQLRQQAGRMWVLAEGMPDPGIAVDQDQSIIPQGAIMVTTVFETPADDLVLSGDAPFKYPAMRSPGSDPKGVGVAYWPWADASQELSVWFGADGSKFQKLSVVGYMGATNLLWVKLS